MSAAYAAYADTSGIEECDLCTDCHGSGQERGLAALKIGVRTGTHPTCSYCGGTGLEDDAQWREDHAEAAEGIARAALTRRCEADLLGDFCAWLASDYSGITAACEGYISWLIRNGNPIWNAAFEAAFTEVKGGQQ